MNFSLKKNKNADIKTKNEKKLYFHIYMKIYQQKSVSNNKPTECQVSFELPNLWNTLDYNQNIAQSVR